MPRPELSGLPIMHSPCRCDPDRIQFLRSCKAAECIRLLFNRWLKKPYQYGVFNPHNMLCCILVMQAWLRPVAHLQLFFTFPVPCLQDSVSALGTNATASTEPAKSAAAAIRAFLVHPASVQLLKSGSSQDSSKSAQPHLSSLVPVLASEASGVTGRARLLWAACARAAVQEAVLAAPADHSGRTPSSMLQQSYWRHIHPQVLLQCPTADNHSKMLIAKCSQPNDQRTSPVLSLH